MSKPKSTTGKYVGVQLDPETYKQMEAYADSRKLKLSEVLRRAIRRLLGVKA